MSQRNNPNAEQGRQSASSARNGTKGHIFYFMYANPAAYPPVEHGSRILADAGWRVDLLGAAAHGTESFRLPPHPRMKSRLWKYEPPGFRQKLHYFAFSLAVLFTAVRTRPDWIYVSDALGSPAGWLLSRLGWRVVYHEHDAPPESEAGRSRFMRFILGMRSRLARRAEFCVLPNKERARQFQAATGTTRPLHCVMNCPRRAEAEFEKSAAVAGQPFVIFYHGTIVPARLPMGLIQAISRLPKHVVFRLAGYETIGHPNYVEALRVEAKRLDLGGRFEYLGPVPQRADLMAECRRADVGIAFMPLVSKDPNEQTMAGASNKAFDYLACGVPVLVSERPEWREMFVAPGFALACQPDNADSIAEALSWFVGHPREARAMGEAGRERVRNEWNYESQFADVCKLISPRTVET